MRFKELKQSKAIVRTLILREMTDYGDKICYVFRDTQDNKYIHYQIKPEFLKGKAKSLAKLFIARLGSNAINGVFNVKVVVRAVDNGFVYHNVDSIISPVFLSNGKRAYNWPEK